MESYAVIGGEGFVGGAIISELLQRHSTSQVASLGLTQRTFSPKSYRFFRTDITSPSSIYDSLKNSGATCVFHTASPHIHADRKTFESVNVEGTRAVIEACKKAGVRKLVFTSTVTVVHEGVDIINGDERLPYAEAKDDYYVSTKITAEKMVLAANGIDGLLTCSLRPAGIIGPGDRQVMPGIISVLKSHQTSFQIGQNLNLFDFVHIKNVVHAHLLAAEKLDAPSVPIEVFTNRLGPVYSTVGRRTLPTSVDEDVTTPTTRMDPPLPAARNRFDPYYDLSPTSSTSRSVAGQAFFITNGEPIPFWSCLRNIWYDYEGHVSPFKLVIPGSVGMALAQVAEVVSWVRGVSAEEGGISKARMRYVLNNMYFNIEKARQILGYEPVISLEEGCKDAVRWLKEDEAKKVTKK